MNFVHPTADISPDFVIPTGCFLDRNVRISHGVFADVGMLVMDGANIGHGLRCEEFCSFGPKCAVSGNCIFGGFVQIGVGAVTLLNADVASGVRVAPNSVVYRSIKCSDSSWLGNPARRMR